MTLKYISSVSRNLTSLDRSWEGVVFQDGNPVLDSELNLAQEIARRNSQITTPSGILSIFPREEALDQFIFGSTPNAFQIKSFISQIAGEEILVAGSNIADATKNEITLPAPSATFGSAPDTKRTDFVFLEVWKQLVTSSSPATALFKLTSNSVGNISFSNGGNNLTLTVAVDFILGADEAETARNIRDALNLPASSTALGLTVEAETNGSEYIFLTFGGGLAGNNVTITAVSGVTIKQPSGGTDGEGMPNSNKVYPYGNTQAHSSLYFDNDILDTFIGEQTTKRVQTQYRFRIYSADYNGVGSVDGVNPKTEYFGFENTNVLAQGGIANPVAGYSFSKADGVDVVRADTNTNSYPFKDSGLFYCGDGTQASATALGTVDGYVYAIPIGYVFRRATGTFDPENYTNNALLSTHAQLNNTALNNGVIVVGAGLSDRPDGQFSDIIYAQDILDLRSHVFPNGLDFSSELVKQFQLLLDNRNTTWAIDSSDFKPLGQASGGISTHPLVCDEIGRNNTTNGGVGATTQRGTFIRDFDHIARRFSNAPVLERVILEVKFDVSENYDGALSVTKVGANGWYEGDTISLDISQLEASSLSQYWKTPSKAGLTVEDCWPDGTKVIDIMECWHDDDNTGGAVPSKEIQLRRVTGLGTDTISLILDRNETIVNLGGNGSQLTGNANDGDIGSDRSVFITLLVEYPAKVGLSATPIGDSLVGDSSIYGTGSVLEYNTTQRPADTSSAPEIYFREGFREVGVEMIGDSVVATFVSDGVGGVTLPWRTHYSDSNIPTIKKASDNANIPIDFANSNLGSSNTYLKFLNDLAAPQLVTVTSNPRYPVSNYGADGYQIACYYRSISPQTCGSKATPINPPSELEIIPVIISDKLWSITQGASTTEGGYPFIAPFEQIGVNPTADSSNFSEADLQGSTFISLEDFDVNTGILSQHSLVPMDQTNTIKLKDPAMDVGKRVVYRKVDTDSYMPSTYARKLGDNVRHKM